MRINLIIVSLSLLLSAAGYRFFFNDQRSNQNQAELLNQVKQSSQHIFQDSPVEPALVEYLSTGQDFVLFEGLKDVFDSLILAADSTEKVRIMRLANEYCHKQKLNLSACAEFSSLFGRYVDYKISLAELDEQVADLGASVAEIDYQLDRLKEIQWRYFTQLEIDVLFANELHFDELALQRKQLALDKSLPKQERERLILNTLQALPEQDQLAFRPSLQMQKLQRIKQGDVDQQQKLLDVENEFGFEAAQRLRVVWQKEEQFLRKVKSIQSEILAFSESGSPNSDAIDDYTSALLSQHFERNQQRRARVLLRAL